MSHLWRSHVTHHVTHVKESRDTCSLSGEGMDMRTQAGLPWKRAVWYKHDVLKRGVRVHAMAYTPLQQTLCDVFVDAHDDLFHKCDITHSCDMTRSYVCSFIRVTWLVHMCGMTRWDVWHDSFISVKWLIHVCPWLVYKCDVAHSCVWCDLSMGVATYTQWVWRHSYIEMPWGQLCTWRLYVTQRCV